MTEVDIDTELLIEEVRRHLELWDVGSEDYKDKSKKIAAWIEVCGTLIADFEAKEEAIKNTLEKNVMSRWRNVRDNFMRSQRKRTKSGKAAKISRKYIYARQLNFLSRTRANITRKASSKTKEIDDSSQEEEGDVEAVGKDPTTHNDEIFGSTRNDNPPQRRVAPTEPPRQRKIEDASIAFMQQRPAPDVNDDQAFFISLLPMVQEFTLDQKLEFRLEVLNMIRRMRGIPTPIPSRP